MNRTELILTILTIQSEFESDNDNHYHITLPIETIELIQNNESEIAIKDIQLSKFNDKDWKIQITKESGAELSLPTLDINEINKFIGLEIE